MSELIVLGFDNEADAFQMKAELVKMQRSHLVEMEDVVVVTRDEEGKVKLHQAVNLAAAGAMGGTFWGALLGLIFMNPLLGAAVGAGAGALSGALSDIGIEDDFMRELGQQLRPNTSALFVLVRKVTPDQVMERLKQFNGNAKVIQTSLKMTDEAALRESLEIVREASGATMPAR